MDETELVREGIEESAKAVKALSAQEIIVAKDIIAKAMSSGGKLLICGNGGSAADAQHMAGELVGRFKMERKALTAISLSTDTSILTALANDYGAKAIFARQVEALGTDGDVLLAISTSGTSPNIIAAVEQAKKTGMKVIGMTGAQGGKLKEMSDATITSASSDTPRIQEAHATAIHLLCQMLEAQLTA